MQVGTLHPGQLTETTELQHEIDPVSQLPAAVTVAPGAVAVTVTVTVFADVVGMFQGVATARTESAKRVKKKVNTRLFILSDVSNGDFVDEVCLAGEKRLKLKLGGLKLLRLQSSRPPFKSLAALTCPGMTRPVYVE